MFRAYKRYKLKRRLKRAIEADKKNVMLPCLGEQSKF